MVGAGFAVGALAFLAALVQPAAMFAGSSRAPETFADVVGEMQLIVVADVTGDPQTGFTYSVDSFLKGTSAPVLEFGPDLQSAVEPGWNRVVLAFSNPTTDDFRAPTIAWHVASDGTIDPEGYQQSVGIPKTLTAMQAYFGVAGPTSDATVPAATVSLATPSASSSGSPVPGPAAAPGESHGPAPLIVVLVVLVVFAFALVVGGAWLRRRPHDIRAR